MYILEDTRRIVALLVQVNESYGTDMERNAGTDAEKDGGNAEAEMR